MITKILSLAVATLMFCSLSVFAVESGNAQEKAPTTSGGVKKTEPQSVKKNVPASQNTKKTVSPAKSAQNTKKPVATNKNTQSTKKQTTTTKKQVTPAKKQTTTAKKQVAPAKKQATTAKKNTNTKQKSTAKNTKQTTAKKPQATNKNAKKATPQKTVAKQATPAKQMSPKAPTVINANAAPIVVPKATILDRPLSQADLKYSSLLSQAQFAYEQKDYKQAIAVMNQAYEIKQEPFVAGNIATLYMLMGDAANCVRMVRTMKVTDPTVVSGLILGLVDRGMLYYAKNIAELTETVRDDGSVAYAKGVMYERLREPQTAEKYYRRAVMMSAHNASYVYALARINDVLKNYERALTLYEDVLALTRRGELYGHSASRIDELKQALKIDE